MTGPDLFWESEDCLDQAGHGLDGQKRLSGPTSSILKSPLNLPSSYQRDSSLNYSEVVSLVGKSSWPTKELLVKLWFHILFI